METSSIVIIVIAAIIVFWLYNTYTKVIKANNMAQAALSSIEIQLRKRYDLIPNVLAIAKKFMTHEKETLAEITALRTHALENSESHDPDSVAELFSTDARLSGMMGKLMVSMEDYPELRSVETMQEAQKTYRDVEDNISAARRYYNSAANELKNAVEIIPSSIFASMLSIVAIPFYDDPESEAIKNTVDATAFFDK